MKHSEMSASTAARILGTSGSTIMRLIKSGDLKARRRGPRCWYRIDRASLNKFMQDIRESLGGK